MDILSLIARPENTPYRKVISLFRILGMLAIVLGAVLGLTEVLPGSVVIYLVLGGVVVSAILSGLLLVDSGIALARQERLRAARLGDATVDDQSRTVSPD